MLLLYIIMSILVNIPIERQLVEDTNQINIGWIIFVKAMKNSRVYQLLP